MNNGNEVAKAFRKARIAGVMLVLLLTFVAGSAQAWEFRTGTSPNGDGNDILSYLVR